MPDPKYAFLYVYGDRDDTPYLIVNPPADFEDLLAEWNELDLEAEDTPDWEPVNTWLKNKGVRIIEILDSDSYCLDDY